MSKGSKRRPRHIDKETYDRNWEQIWERKQSKQDRRDELRQQLEREGFDEIEIDVILEDVL